MSKGYAELNLLLYGFGTQERQPHTSPGKLGKAGPERRRAEELAPPLMGFGIWGSEQALNLT